jgi:long-chain acyl-CoA synthetase
MNYNSMITIPQRVLGEALFRTAERLPFKTAIIVKGIEYSYSQLKENAVNLARYLIHAGIKKGDKVAIYMDNSWQSIISIYGTTLSGAVFLVINPQTKADKLKYILNDCAAKILLSAYALKNELSPVLDRTTGVQEIIITGGQKSFSKISPVKVVNFDDIIRNNHSNVSFPNIIANDLAALIYTSGSTGFPKGVMMTHQSMVFTSWSLIEYLRLSEKDRIILVLQLAFDYGLYQLLMVVSTGGTLIVEQSFTFTATIYENIRKYKPTVFPGVPTIFAMMIAANKRNGLSFDCIEKITNTAALLPADSIPDLKKIFPNALIFKMYGLTECKRVCYLEPELIDLKPDSVGKAIPGTEVFLLSPQGDPVPAGEPGILHIRGPHIMTGYLNKPDLTKEMLKDGKLPGDKILCSNDWFKMDEEGFLYFQGRNDDIIKTRGEKVSPVEVENTIYKIKGVKEVAVLGVPDIILGESIIAFITTHEKVKLTEKDIQRECMIYLEPFMIPQKVFFLPEMPKNSNGKIDRKELKNVMPDEIVRN